MKKTTKKNNHIHRNPNSRSSMNRGKKVFDTNLNPTSSEIIFVDKHNYCLICYNDGYNQGYKEGVIDGKRGLTKDKI